MEYFGLCSYELTRNINEHSSNIDFNVKLRDINMILYKLSKFDNSKN